MHEYTVGADESFNFMGGGTWDEGGVSETMAQRTGSSCRGTIRTLLTALRPTLSAMEEAIIDTQQTELSPRSLKHFRLIILPTLPSVGQTTLVFRPMIQQASEMALAWECR